MMTRDQIAILIASNVKRIHVVGRGTLTLNPPMFLQAADAILAELKSRSMG